MVCFIYIIFCLNQAAQYFNFTVRKTWKLLRQLTLRFLLGHLLHAYLLVSTSLLVKLQCTTAERTNANCSQRMGKQT